MRESLVALYDRVENEDPRLTDPIALAMVQRILAKQRAAALITDAQARAPKGSSIGGQWVGKNGGNSGRQGSRDKVVGKEGDWTYVQNELQQYRKFEIESVKQAYEEDRKILDEIRELSITSDVVFGEESVNLNVLVSGQSTLRAENLDALRNGFDVARYKKDSGTVIFMPDGTAFLKDGNHRTTVALEQGVTKGNFSTIRFVPFGSTK